MPIVFYMVLFSENQ